MKNTLSCAKCGNRRLWVIDRVMRSDDGSNNIMIFNVTVGRAPEGSPPGRRKVGYFQTIICESCGYTEWYAQDIEALKELAGEPTAGVRLVDGEPGSSGPFR